MSVHRHAKIHVALSASLVTLGFAAQANPDAARGEQLYARCLGCHSLTTDRVGPRHCGVLGRRAGSVANFDYSAAMKQSGIVWNETTLNRFLTKPLVAVPGSSMTYDGVPEVADRVDLIAYLKRVNTDAACRTVPKP